MLFVPIRTASDLPRESQAREGNSLEFKVQLNSIVVHGGKQRVDSFAIAKDAAAFANSYGGTIIIGAGEDKATKAIHYVSMTDVEAENVRRSVEESIRDRCRPQPFVEVLSLLSPADQFIVACNVWPVPGQVVGVKIDGDSNDGYGGPAYVFPLRTTSQCSWITPENIPMFTLPATRRIAILVDGIPSLAGSSQTNVCFLHDSGTHDGRRREVDVLSNRAVFDVVDAANRLSGKIFVPLDHIVTVWRDETQWLVQLTGTVVLNASESFFAPRRVS